jgi:hypothetical protein
MERTLLRFFREGGEVVSTLVAIPREIVDVIADEMAGGVDRAVECWMSRIEQALEDTSLTSLGRLHAVKEIVEQYKKLTGKVELEARRA